MAKILSPGQKKKRFILWLVFVVFAIATLLASVVVGRLTSSMYAWVDQHGFVVATVDDVYQSEEEYRNSKGRRRTRTLYYVAYSFPYDDHFIENEVEVSSSVFKGLDEGADIEVWYDPEHPYINDTASNLTEITGSANLIGSAIRVAPYTAGGFLVLYNILVSLFARESKKILPKGFYGQRSWLDVDDKVMVVAEGRTIIYFDINKHHVGEVQEAYQRGDSLEELIRLSKTTEVNRIPMAEITVMKSDHKKDQIVLEHKNETHYIEFLNVAVKNHALRRFQLMMPENMTYEKVERTRLKAAFIPILALGTLIGIVWFFDMFAIKLLVSAVALLLVFPKALRELVNPTQSERWAVQ